MASHRRLSIPFLHILKASLALCVGTGCGLGTYSFHRDLNANRALSTVDASESFIHGSNRGGKLEVQPNTTRIQAVLSQIETGQLTLVIAVIALILFFITAGVCCCCCLWGTAIHSSARLSAHRISLMLRCLFLPDPFRWITRVSHGFIDGSAVCATLGPLLMEVGSVFLLLWLSGSPLLKDLSFLTMLCPWFDLVPAMGFLIFGVGLYLWLVKTGAECAIAAITRELRREDVGALDIAKAYGGRKPFMKDVSKCLDTACTDTIKKLLVGPEVLRVDIIVRCMSTGFFSWVKGDDASRQVLLVSVLLTASEAQKNRLNTDPSLEKALHSSVQCKRAPLADVLAQYAYPHGETLGEELTGDDYGKAMLGLSVCLQYSKGAQLAKLLEAVISANDHRNLMRLLLCCPVEQGKDMVRVFNATYRTKEDAAKSQSPLIARIDSFFDSAFGHLEELGTRLVSSTLSNLKELGEELEGDVLHVPSAEPSKITLYRHALTELVHESEKNRQHMHVRVLSASNLPEFGSNFFWRGSNDIYVAIKVGKHTVKSKVLSEPGSNPKWDELLAPIPVDLDTAPMVNIVVRNTHASTAGQVIVDNPMKMAGTQEFVLHHHRVEVEPQSNLVFKVCSVSGLDINRDALLYVRITVGEVARHTLSVSAYNLEWNESLVGFSLGPDAKAKVEVVAAEGGAVLAQCVVDLKKVQAGKAQPQSSCLAGAATFCGKTGGGDWLDVHMQEPMKASSGNPKVNLSVYLLDFKGQSPSRAGSRNSTAQSEEPMRLKLETHLYKPGEAPWETSESASLETQLHEELQGRRRKASLLVLLIKATDSEMQLLRHTNPELMRRVFALFEDSSTITRALSDLDNVAGTFNSADELDDLVHMIKLDNCANIAEGKFSDRFLHELRSCMTQTMFGVRRSDDLGLICLLMMADDQDALHAQYRQKFGRDLSADLTEATSHSAMLQELIMGLAHADVDWIWARSLWESMNGGWTGIGVDTSTLSDILCLHSDRLDVLQEKYLEISTKRGQPESLKAAIANETSGELQCLLLSLLRTGRR